jgi:hypothetical protein
MQASERKSDIAFRTQVAPTIGARTLESRSRSSVRKVWVTPFGCDFNDNRPQSRESQHQLGNAVYRGPFAAQDDKRNIEDRRQPRCRLEALCRPRCGHNDRVKASAL